MQRKSKPLCKTSKDRLTHQIFESSQDEMSSAKDEFARAQTFAKIRAAKRKKASLEALLQLLSESREQEAAAQALNEKSQHSEPLRLAAQAVMDASVQSSFHQFRVASRVFLILPLVRAVDPSSSESDGLAGAIVKFIHGGHLAWQSGGGEEMVAGICHTYGADSSSSRICKPLPAISRQTSRPPRSRTSKLRFRPEGAR